MSWWREPRWRNADEDELLSDENRILRHISRQLRHIIELLTPPTVPDECHLHPIGVPVPVEITADQTQVTYSFTETAQGVEVPNEGTAVFTVDDASVLSGVDNGDGTFTVTRASGAGGTTNVNLTVTLPDGSTVLTATPDTVTVDAQVVTPDAVTLVPGTPS